MLRRVFSGLVLGAVLGGLVAAAIVSGLGPTFAGTAGILLAYGSALAVGAVTGLVAGKPIWAPGAKVEAGLKAFFGALLAAGGMFALRQWAQGWIIDLSLIHAGGRGSIGDLPAASLPLIAGVLGGFFELDNTGEPHPVGEPSEKKRVVASESARSSKAVPPAGDVEEEEAPAAPKRAGR
jgi:hypothetical protein